MKHFIVEITYTASAEEIGEVLPEHRNFLELGYSKGWLLLSGPQVPKEGGVVVARAPSVEEIEAFFAEDPFQTRGVATYRFIEFDPVKRQSFLNEWALGTDWP